MEIPHPTTNKKKFVLKCNKTSKSYRNDKEGGKERYCLDSRFICRDISYTSSISSSGPDHGGVSQGRREVSNITSLRSARLL